MLTSTAGDVWRKAMSNQYVFEIEPNYYYYEKFHFVAVEESLSIRRYISGLRVH